MRCSWCNENNPKYVEYHDKEWGVPRFDDRYLFEMLVLESFQAGLSWECILNKRDNFRAAYDGFDVEKVSLYDENKQQELAQNGGIIRNKLKIRASINNAKVFRGIQREFGTFADYIKTFTHGETFFETGRVSSPLSDALSADLKKRGMKFAGTVIIYSYLQAIGVINSHEESCFLHNAL